MRGSDSEHLLCDQGVDLVFVGDSITESWRGTQLGSVIERAAKVPEVFAKHYGALKAAVYAIAGAPHGNPMDLSVASPCYPSCPMHAGNAAVIHLQSG